MIKNETVLISAFNQNFFVDVAAHTKSATSHNVLFWLFGGNNRLVFFFIIVFSPLPFIGLSYVWLCTYISCINDRPLVQTMCTFLEATESVSVSITFGINECMFATDTCSHNIFHLTKWIYFFMFCMHRYWWKRRFGNRKISSPEFFGGIARMA